MNSDKKKAMLSFLETLQHAPHIAVDTESDPETDLFLGFSIAYQRLGMYFPVGHLQDGVNIDDEVFDTAMKVIDNAPLRVFQHAGYDLGRFQYKLGHILHDKRFVCTMTMAHMINENTINKSLDSLHRKYVKNGQGKFKNKVMEDITQKLGWRYVPILLMEQYASQDAIITSELYTALEPLYKEQFGEMFS